MRVGHHALLSFLHRSSVGEVLDIREDDVSGDDSIEIAERFDFCAIFL